MEIGLGLDSTLNLSFADQEDLSLDAARMGYTSLWTPESLGQDAFQLCTVRWAATRQERTEGLTTGISVAPVMYRSPLALAMSGGTLSERTGGRFIMGIGSGSVSRPSSRQAIGMGRVSALAMMRDYLITVKGLVNGEQVNYQGDVVTLRGMKLAIDPPPRTPVYLGALGPEMVRLSGELADGVCLNWCTPEQIAWSRDRIAEGAARAGRDPGDVQVTEYIRVCVDEDPKIARRAFSLSIMEYALGRRTRSPRERSTGYRAHFERMGFVKELAELDRMRELGESHEKVAEAFPVEVLRRVGYFGSAQGASQAFQKLAEGLDVAVVRVVAARPGLDSVRAVMETCRPA